MTRFTALLRHRGRAFRRSAVACLSAVSVLLATSVLPPETAAQTTRAAPPLKERPLPKPRDRNAPMLVEAEQAIYNDDDDSVAAVGNAQIYYDGQTLEADRVTFYRKTGRVVAEGRVRLQDRDGNVLYADRLDVTRDFSKGFIQSVLIDSARRTRFAADAAERGDGNVTVLTNGVYTACTRCQDRPDKPPTWQIKAAKIIHNQQEKAVYFYDASFELWGVPIAYLPYFSAPDPQVKRKTGFLAPRVIYKRELGVGVQVPYFWAPRDDWDVTFAPTAFTRQGGLFDAEVRHRVVDGSYSIRAAGIHQIDPSAFRFTSGDTRYRGAVFTQGKFHINDQWTWGWDVSLGSDRKFVKDYALTSGDRYELPSTLYLTGIGERNYFDLRGRYYQVQQDDTRNLDPKAQPLPNGRPNFYLDELQSKQPIVHPVLDYNMVFGNPVLGGELKLDTNFTSLSRFRTDWTRLALVAGAEGTFTRASADLQWRRQLIDPLGQVFTPFWSLRGDVFFIDNRDPLVSQLSNEDVAFRGMPTLGLEYRWPFLGALSLGPHMLGTQIFEPIAQLVVRPNEVRAGKLPNEDAQSLVFDDTSLFDRDKFSGFDRVEGGTRLNLGFRYTVQTVHGGAVSALIGRSYHIAGDNPFLSRDLLLLGAESGLESRQSDWVTRLYVDTGLGLRLGARARFDDHDFALNRTELQASALTGPVTTSLIYAYLRAQPSLGFANDREEVQGAVNVRLADTWRVFGGVRYDLHNKLLVRNMIGFGYDDDSLSLSLAYAEDTDREQSQAALTRVVRDQMVFFRFGLRTLGDGGGSTNLLQ